jgi:hypothetical protein
MPRDSNGVYGLPLGNPVVSDTVIETDWANPTMGDVATELTRSLDRLGRGPMQAPLLLVDGARAAPGMAFNLDQGSGMYRDPVTGAWRFTLSGQDVMEFYLDVSDPDVPVPSINLIGAVSLGATTTTFDDGTVLQPGVRFTDEQQSGLYRAGTNDVGLGVGQSDLLRARKSDGVRFPYDGEGSQVSLQRGASGRIGRMQVNTAGDLNLYNGARGNALGTVGIAEQSLVTQLALTSSALLVNAHESQVIGNSLTSPVQVLKADSTGVYDSTGKLATRAYADSILASATYLPLAGGTLTAPGHLTTPGNISAVNLTASGTVTATGNITTSGTLIGPNASLSSSLPAMQLTNTSAAVDNKRAQFFGNSDGSVYLQPLTDAGTAQSSFVFGRTGNYAIGGAYARTSGASGSWGSIDVVGTKAGYAGVRFNDVGMTLMMQATSGNQGFISDAGAWAMLISNGSVTFPGNVTAFSDERVKTDMRPIERLALPDRLRALRYQRTDQEMTQVGVSAQALREILPECVNENDKGMLSVDYGRAALVLLLKLIEGEVSYA